MCKTTEELLKKRKREKILVHSIQILLVFLFLILWEVLADKKIISSFLFSSPSKVWETILGLLSTGEIWKHIFTTLYETLLSFTIGISVGFILAIFLYELPLVSKIVDPFLTMLNSLPKVALRTCNNNMGRCWYTSNYCNGSFNFISCNNT